MKYKLPVTIIVLENGDYMARCNLVRATATGSTAEEAIKSLHEAIVELVQEFGEKTVFQDVMPNTDLQVLEVAL